MATKKYWVTYEMELCIAYPAREGLYPVVVAGGFNRLRDARRCAARNAPADIEKGGRPTAKTLERQGYYPC